MPKQKNSFDKDDKKDNKIDEGKEEDKKENKKEEEKWIGKHSMKGIPPEGIPEGEKI